MTLRLTMSLSLTKAALDIIFGTARFFKDEIRTLFNRSFRCSYIVSVLHKTNFGSNPRQGKRLIITLNSKFRILLFLEEPYGF